MVNQEPKTSVVVKQIAKQERKAGKQEMASSLKTALANEAQDSSALILSLQELADSTIEECEEKFSELKAMAQGGPVSLV